MIKIILSNRFKKDLKQAKRQNRDLNLLNDVVKKLANQEALPIKNRDHELNGTYKGFRECHIQPDWLLIYKIESQSLLLLLSRTGSHSDLF